jgi:hypothetical protein
MKTALKKLVRKLFLTCLNICQDEILSLVARNANAIFGAPDRSALADPLLVPPKMTDQLSQLTPREVILKSFVAMNRVLEIGPFDRPLLKGHNVVYLEAFDTDFLKQRASQIEGRSPSNVPYIHYVGQSGIQAATSNEKFDGIISSHLLEHQPNLLGHLKDVLMSLNMGGKYFAIFPDKSQCFDHFIPVSEIPEILAAYFEDRSKPSLRSIIEHRAFTEHNFTSPQVQNPFDRYVPGKINIIHAALKEFNEIEYVDVHTWYFTKTSAERIFLYVKESGILNSEFDFRLSQRGAEIELELVKL